MKKNVKGLFPVLFAFFVMGFCDVAGVATSYVKNDFNLSEGLAGLIPSAVFLWFLILSIPAATMMNRIGRKRTVILSNAITIVATLIPLFAYTLETCLLSFALLGIGNTILQVSLNPLMTNVVEEKKLSGALTGGQVVKALSSFAGPFLVMLCMNITGKWQMIFPLYAIVTVISTVWLSLTGIAREETTGETADIFDCFRLLSDRKILLIFLGIFFLVGTDVGMNTVSPKLLMDRCGMTLKEASLSPSIYFLCRTVGSLLGTFLLTRVDNTGYYGVNILCAAIALSALFFVRGAVAILILVGLIGFFCSSLFSVLFGYAMNIRSDKANEVSGLMITGIAGGAVIPPLMGIMTDLMGSQTGSLAVIALCVCYLLAFAVPFCRRNG